MLVYSASQPDTLPPFLSTGHATHQGPVDVCWHGQDQQGRVARPRPTGQDQQGRVAFTSSGVACHGHVGIRGMTTLQEIRLHATILLFDIYTVDRLTLP